MIKLYLVRPNDRPNVSSLVYDDESGLMRVAYTGRAKVTQGSKILQEATPDMPLATYIAEHNLKDFSLITPEAMSERCNGYEESRKTKPESVTLERFYDALNCMPPSRYGFAKGVIHFHICERLTGNLVQWFIRFPSTNSCYTFIDDASITEDQLCEHIKYAKQQEK